MLRHIRFISFIACMLLAAQVAFSQYTGGSFDGYTSSRSDDILYEGTTPIVTGDELPDIVHNLTINNPAGVTLTKNIIVNGKLILIGGTLNLNGFTIALGDLAQVIEVPGNTATGIIGEITTTRILNDLRRGVNIAGLGFEIKTDVPLGKTTIDRGHAPQPLAPTNVSALRYFDVDPANNENLNATVEFHYDESELGGTPEEDLIMFKSKNAAQAGAVGKHSQLGIAAVDTIIWQIVGGTVDPQANTVCKGSEGDFSRWTVGRGYVLFAEKKIKLKGNEHSQGDMHSNGDIIFQKGEPGRHVGNLSAVGNIKIEKHNRIEGNVTAGKRVLLSEDAMITGEVNEGVEFTPLKLPDFRLVSGRHDIKVPKHGSLELSPGDYGEVEVGKRATLYLSSGEYFMEELDLDDGAVLSVAVDHGQVIINVEDDLEFDSEVEMVITPLGLAGTNLVTFNTTETGEVEIGEDATILGSIFAPFAKVKFSEDSRIKGSVYAEAVILDDDVVFVPHSSTVRLERPTIDFEVAEETDQTTGTVTDYALEQNYPNPFNPSTTIRYRLRAAGHAQLAIYDLEGRRVRLLVNGEKDAGVHISNWDGRGDDNRLVTSGIYLYRLTANGFEETRSMSFLK